MAMAVDNRQQSQLHAMPFDQMRGYHAPQFTNPWVSAASGAPSSQHMYASSMAPTSSAVEQSGSRPTAISMPYAGSVPVTASALGPGSSLPEGLFETENLLAASQEVLNSSRGYAAPQYATSSSPTAYAPAPSAQYPIEYGARSGYPYQDRRSSHPSVPSAAFIEAQMDAQRQRQRSLVDFTDRMNSQQAQRNSFSEALDASRGMVAMSQADITPRNIYGNQNPRSSTDSYGFPATHSSHSSISSASTYPSYYNGSVADSSVTDYSSASESVDMNPRTLPRPSALVGTNLPAPSSMMSQFSSKVSSSSQKKHKCKICDKRFTRPSSLQTHMYSHTGEKPFACEVEGCGRHFSVVSNLRRHRKVHKGENGDHPSPDDS
ncbi:hypothetical protein K402DRAFT_326115 [Aulographum hederae CBS 113979]|uniref:C2H2-type domain-containing protein n=1 Tax=Aulographum hederae CBS 113979 TaxID=1176131 RepID=A0A6G1H9E4_9PEZI|nr:hypothetical protein K402DRAFT_326115 [Aulographum hederae CBS 113979]